MIESESRSGMTSYPAFANSSRNATTSSLLGFGMGGRMKGRGMSPLSQVAILYLT